MTEQRSMEEAISKFVESLEEEQKSNKLIESKNKIKTAEEKEEEKKEEEIKEKKEIKNDNKVEKNNINNNFIVKNEDDIGKIKEFIARVVNSICNSEVSEIKYDKEKNEIDIYGKDLGIAIGKNGKNMEALEYIINIIAKKKNILNKSVTIDIKDYRKKKYAIMKNLAIRMAKKAVKEGRKIVLKPMPSYERKIIHDILSDNKEVKTVSKNKEPYRRIIIYPNKEK
ncbi:MAG: KH domain-containing protein [Actinobacteria bacterium]|nr:KH domain-containing protein [Cyanobacteriota bacterium]MCL5772410.1 KH domain-containing protein [Actinomycetota bacterium]